MNRALFIILVPVALVSIGYVIVFRAMAMPLPWLEFLLPVVLLAAATAWLARRKQRGKEIRT
jgi:hypothetical protein